MTPFCMSDHISRPLLDQTLRKHWGNCRSRGAKKLSLYTGGGGGGGHGSTDQQSSPYQEIAIDTNYQAVDEGSKTTGAILHVGRNARNSETLWMVKGAVSRYSVIFCAFLREQKMAVAHTSVADIKPESLAVRAAWQPGHLRWLLTWQCREPTTSRAGVALLHLSTATGSTFVFRQGGPSKVISPSSRFKISSDSYIDIDSLFSCLVLRAFRSLLRRSRRRPHGWLGEGIGSVVVAPFPVTLTMCVTVKANALNEEQMSTFVPTQAVVVAFAQYVTKTWRLKKRTCGKLWGRPGRSPRTFEGDAQGPCMSSLQLFSARRCTFEHCTSHCCLSRDATMVALTEKKKKRQTPLTTPRKRSFEGRCQRRKRDVLSSPQFGGG